MEIIAGQQADKVAVNPKILVLFQKGWPSISESAGKRLFVRSFKGQCKRWTTSDKAWTVHVENHLCIWLHLYRKGELPIKAWAFVGRPRGEIPPCSGRFRYFDLNLELIAGTW